MGTDVADITENKTDEHEEETDQREGCGRADHLWKRNPPVVSSRSRIKYSFQCTPTCFPSDSNFPHVMRSLTPDGRSFLSSPLFCSAFAVLGNRQIDTAPPFLSC